MQLLKLFMLFFALILFVMSTYYVIKFAHGEAPTRTGIIAIVSLIGSICYPIYFFSVHNSAYRQDLILTVFPMGSVVTQLTGIANRIADSAANRAADRIQDRAQGAIVAVNEKAQTGVSKFISAGFNAIFAVSTLALLTPVVGLAAPVVAEILASAYVTVGLPAIAFASTFINEPTESSTETQTFDTFLSLN
jgi:hypothetical protein